MSSGCHRPAAPPHKRFKPDSRDSISDRVGSQSWRDASKAGGQAAATVLEGASGHTTFCRKHNPVRNHTIRLHICRTITSNRLSCNRGITNCNRNSLCIQYSTSFVRTLGIIDSTIYIRHYSPGSGSVHCYVPLVPPTARYLQPGMSSKCQAIVM